ncbi:MAG TPA: YidC/Oxa1 family membrane protein insertase [Candidatus Saccharimonadales bacterium]|nr:YidC/Oxa1 family membrane protein insertase [Candidatus Saccharimonadales bacterium]
MFTTFIVQPIFNLLVFIYAILPGHNFGLALIIFTVLVRLLMWPLVKKQLHQAKAMRELQPEIKKIKKATKGNRQKESQMLMELYKERGINPLGTLPILAVQLIVLIGLYSGLRKVIDDPQSLISFTYPAIQDMSWMRHLADNIHAFDNTLFGWVDLSRAAISQGMPFYVPAFIIVTGSAVAQFFQGKQLLPTDKDQKGLRDILKQASDGNPADQSEVTAAVGRSTLYLLPVMIFVFTIGLASALSLYWLVTGVVAYIQQSIILAQDEEEMEGIADKPARRDLSKIPEAQIIEAAAGEKKAKKAARRKKKRKK